MTRLDDASKLGSCISCKWHDSFIDDRLCSCKCPKSYDFLHVLLNFHSCGWFEKLNEARNEDHTDNVRSA